MAVNKKTAGTILIVVGILIIVSGLLYFFRCRLFNLASCIQDPNKDNTPVPSGSPTTKWIPETPPYNVGMFGAKIKQLQKVLGVTQDAKFGNQTKSAIIAKGYSVPLSQPDYNTIVNTFGGSGAQNIKGAYAKYDTTVFNKSDLSVNRKAKKDTWIGLATGTDSSNIYYELDGMYYVAKSSVYLKG